MPVTEEVAAVGSVLLRASALLDTLNDAIERALKSENKLYYSSSTRRSPTTPLEQGSLTASSDSPGEYAYMLGGDSYVMPSRPATYQGRTGVGEAYRPYASLSSGAGGGGGIGRGEVKGEAKILSEIRESLVDVEEHLYKVQELQEHRQEERTAAIREVDQKREQLLQLLKDHKGQEWQVVEEIVRFCGGEAPQQLGASTQAAPQVYTRSLVSPFSSAQPTPYQQAGEAGLGASRAGEDSQEVSDNEQEEVLLLLARNTQGELEQRGAAGYGGVEWRGAQRRLVEDWEEEEEGGEGELSGNEDEGQDDGLAIVLHTQAPEMRGAAKGDAEGTAGEEEGDGQVDDGEEIGSGETSGADGDSSITQEETRNRRSHAGGGKGGLGQFVMGLPAKTLGVLGDAAGHVASFTVKVAVVSLGIAAVLSLGEELTQMRRRRQQPVLQMKLTTAKSLNGKNATPQEAARGAMERSHPNRKAAVLTPKADQSQSRSETGQSRPESGQSRSGPVSIPPHSHFHDPALLPDEARHRVFGDGAFPLCTIRERVEKKSIAEPGGKQAVFLGRG